MSLAFERDLLAERLGGAATAVLETMFFSSADEGAPEDAADESGVGRIGASLDFHGACTGRLELSLDRDTASELAVNFFGDLGHQEPEEDCRSVMAELTNMVCGTMLSQLDRHAIFCLNAPEPMPDGEEPTGEVEKTFRVEQGLLRLAFTLRDAGAPDEGRRNVSA